MISYQQSYKLHICISLVTTVYSTVRWNMWMKRLELASASQNRSQISSQEDCLLWEDIRIDLKWSGMTKLELARISQAGPPFDRSALPGRLFVIGGCIGCGRRLNLAHQWKSLNAIPLQVTELRGHERHWCGIFTTVPELHTTAIKTSPTHLYLHIANKDNLLFKHCITTGCPKKNALSELWSTSIQFLATKYSGRELTSRCW